MDWEKRFVTVKEEKMGPATLRAPKSERRLFDFEEGICSRANYFIMYVIDMYK